jgi:hypothetical protein
VDLSIDIGFSTPLSVKNERPWKSIFTSGNIWASLEKNARASAARFLAERPYMASIRSMMSG